jgi:hypothetical protein
VAKARVQFGNAEEAECSLLEEVTRTQVKVLASNVVCAAVISKVLY